MSNLPLGGKLATAAVAVALAATGAAADPAPAASLATTSEAPSPRRHAIYVDLLGKGGAWGLGYEYRAKPWLALGAVASYYRLHGDGYTTLSPYVGLYPVTSGHHGWFVQVGPQIVRHSTASPGPEWPGMSTVGYGAELSTGYEYRSSFLFRLYGMVTVGDRVAPWLGASIGWTL